MRRYAFMIVFGFLFLMAAPAQSAGYMTWKMVKYKGLRTVHLESFESRDACETQAQLFNQKKDGWKYKCRAR